MCGTYYSQTNDIYILIHIGINILYVLLLKNLQSPCLLHMHIHKKYQSPVPRSPRFFFVCMCISLSPLCMNTLSYSLSRLPVPIYSIQRNYSNYAYFYKVSMMLPICIDMYAISWVSSPQNSKLIPQCIDMYISNQFIQGRWRGLIIRNSCLAHPRSFECLNCS